LRPCLQCWRGLSVVGLLGLACLAGISQGASIHHAKIKELKKQAEFYEKQADWEKAAELYESVLRLDRGLADVRQRHQHCLRRAWQVGRHRDASYRKEVLSLGFGQSLRLYDLMLETLLDGSLDKRKANAGMLFRKGLDELRLALSDPFFRQTYLSGVKDEDIQALSDQLRRWSGAKVQNAGQAVERAREVALTTSNLLGMDPTTVVMELLCGACYGLDEYTAYLTPTQLRELCEALKGEFVGVGITLGLNGNRLIIVDVAMGSSAKEKGVSLNDRVLAIDKKDVAMLTPDAAQELLEGPNGTSVELALETPAGMRMVVLSRRPLFIASVAHQILTDADKFGVKLSAAALPVGYVSISSFQETTAQELDLALLDLNKSGMKSLILDLRGNRGGLFDSAIECAKRFLPTGVITSTQNSDPTTNTVYQSRNPNALPVPIVVLIDGDTASAAEILAGALKENQRARLIGKNTFGKGCTQTLCRLPAGPSGTPTGGLRITITRFFSPTGQPYSGRGIAPHLAVERFATPEAIDGPDLQFAEALLETQRLIESAQRSSS